MVKTRIRTLFRRFFDQETEISQNVQVMWHETIHFCFFPPGKDKRSIQPAFPQIIAQQTSCFPQLFFNCINGPVKYLGYFF
jgi:hypothetical protein